MPFRVPFLLKPGFVEKYYDLIGELYDAFGFILVEETKEAKIGEKGMAELYKGIKDKPYYQKNLTYVTSGVIKGLIFEVEVKESKVDELMEKLDKWARDPNTGFRIRNSFKITENVIHVSRTKQEAEQEIKLFHDKEFFPELHWSDYPNGLVMKKQLKKHLDTLNAVYKERNLLAQMVVEMCNKLNTSEVSGVREGTENDDWPVITGSLKSGEEIAWHVPKEELLLSKISKRKYDGHTTEEKYKRCKEYIEASQQD